jgi:hypothetical protein
MLYPASETAGGWIRRRRDCGKKSAIADGRIELPPVAARLITRSRRCREDASGRIGRSQIGRQKHPFKTKRCPTCPTFDRDVGHMLVNVRECVPAPASVRSRLVRSM